MGVAPEDETGRRTEAACWGGGVRTRRELLRAVVAGAGAYLLAGCGGGGGHPAEATRGIAVAVAPELAGTDRQIISALAPPASLAPDGSAQTTVANGGAQLLLLTDGSGAARALSVCLPGASVVHFGIPETALALLFITPGILSVDGGEAADRLARLSLLTAFPPFLAALADRLSPASGYPAALADLRNDSGLESLRAVVLTEWIAGNPLVGGSRKASRSWRTDVARVEVGFSGTEAIRLESAAWRDAALLRERFDAYLNPVRDTDGPVTATLEGAMPLTWGALLDVSRFYLGTADDRPEVDSDPPVGLLRYTVYGPGRATPNVPLPLALSATDPYGPTFLFTLALPLVDLMLGSPLTLSRGWLTARVAWQRLATVANPGTARELLRQGDAARTAQALVPLTDTALDFAPQLADLYQLNATPTPGDAAGKAVATDAIRRAVGLLSSANLGFAIETWLSYPEVAVYDLPVTSGEVVVK